MKAKKPRCTKLVRYETRTDALHALRRLGEKGRDEVRVFRCGKHNRTTWHLTSTFKYGRKRRQ